MAITAAGQAVEGRVDRLKLYAFFLDTVGVTTEAVFGWDGPGMTSWPLRQAVARRDCRMMPILRRLVDHGPCLQGPSGVKAEGISEPGKRTPHFQRDCCGHIVAVSSLALCRRAVPERLLRAALLRHGQSRLVFSRSAISVRAV